MAKYILTIQHIDCQEPEDSFKSEFSFEGSELDLKKALLADIYEDWDCNDFETPDAYFDEFWDKTYWEDVTRTIDDFEVNQSGTKISGCRNNFEDQVLYTAFRVSDDTDLSEYEPYTRHTAAEWDELRAKFPEPNERGDR